MKILLMTAFVALTSASAFADGQENRGGALDGPEVASCDGNQVHVSVHQNNAAGFITALVNQLPAGGTTPFGVKEIKPAPHIVGAPRRYEGQGFALSICTDCAPMGGFPGNLHVPSLGIEQSVRCELK